MGLVRKFTVSSLSTTQSGEIQFFTPQPSDETVLVTVPAKVEQDLFVHRFQTDQLSVAKGSIVMVLLQNGRYEYVLLSDRTPEKMLTIPPGIPHGVVNLSSEPCRVVNALLRHGPVCESDYRPRKPRFAYDLKQVRAKLMELEVPAGV
ncbi:MAG: dTDP-4-dehydrorhamnose 3,5-epimerase [Cyanothece sp. SIO2G6]|nr:dTDP-4-dehydrorhamnose 3,5-epimerase [Cyanothece sp. SIO2G6]